jgi:hypothetical protein
LELVVSGAVGAGVFFGGVNFIAGLWIRVFDLQFVVQTFKMPVFHTKTIESILEPVAQQVRYLFGR